MSALSQPQDSLNNEWRLLQQHWQVACTQWNDAARHRFGREYWQEFEAVMPPVLTQLSKLADVVAQAQREVQ